MMTERFWEDRRDHKSFDLCFLYRFAIWEKKNWTTFSSTGLGKPLGVLSLFILYTVWTKCYNFDLNNVIDFYWDFHFHRDFFCQLPVSLDQVIIKLKYIFFKKHICVSSIWKKRTLYMIMYVAHNNLFISACNIERLWLHAFDL